MTRFKSITTIIISIIILTVVSCKDSPTKPPSDPEPIDFIYPLEIGNRWSYENISYYTDFAPESLADLHPDTILKYDELKITGLDTLYGTTEIFIFDEIDFPQNPGYGDTTFSRAYYNNHEDGLYYYGTTSHNHAIPKQSKTGLTFEFDGKLFQSSSQLMAYIQGGILKSGKVLGDVIENPPLKSIDYSFELGTQWVYKDSSHLSMASKELESIQSVRTTAGNFNCIVIKWLYKNDNIYHYDYVSKSGLVKRLIAIKNVNVIDSTDLKLGTVTLSEEFNLTDYLIVE